jgi:hypothetical protein
MMVVDWSGNLMTRDGQKAQRIEDCAISGKKRCYLGGDAFASPDDRRTKNLTAWRFSEDGISRCDGAQSGMDIINGILE